MKRSSSLIRLAPAAAAALLMTAGCGSPALQVSGDHDEDWAAVAGDIAAHNQPHNIKEEAHLGMYNAAWWLGDDPQVMGLDVLESAQHRDAVPVVSADGEVVEAIFAAQQAPSVVSGGHVPMGSLRGFVSIPRAAEQDFTRQTPPEVCDVDAAQWQAILDALNTSYDKLQISCGPDGLDVTTVNIVPVQATSNGRVVVSKAPSKASELSRTVTVHQPRPPRAF